MSYYARNGYSKYFLICTVSERNRIRKKLRDADWSDLVNELELTNQLTSIHGACSRDLDPVNCYLRQVLNKFIESRLHETCDRAVEKIVAALESLGKHYQATAADLREMFLTGESCVHMVCKDTLG